MMGIGLDAIMGALGAEGIAVVRCVAGIPAVEAEVLHRAGVIGPPTLQAGKLLRHAAVGVPAVSVDASGRPTAAAVCQQASDEKFGVVLWRRCGARLWTDDDVLLIDSVAGIARLLMDRDAGLHRLTPTDTLTALLSQRSFIVEATRQMARLDCDHLPGTLMLAEVDNLQSVGELLGPDGNEQVLRRAAVLLRRTVRPTDLVGRTGDAEFAVWLSGADHLTAAERAEDLCREAPSRIIGPENAGLSEVSFSIGIATRQTGESLADLASRATNAKREVKLEGGGYWRVSLSNVG
jgi:diguanylate cyclase (GGDEF)-like protein